jgi:hypothetical protein
VSTTAELDVVEIELGTPDVVESESRESRHARPPRHGAEPRKRTRTGRGTAATGATMFALATVTAVGAAIRARGFSNLGLFRDDAWVAMSAKVGLGTAWHMWVTAPGFYFLERTFIAAGAGTTSWDQGPVFVAAVACIPATYALIRYFRLGRVVGLVAALLVSVSPVCVAYATRIKEYPVDFLLVCALLALAEAVRRRPAPTRVAALALCSVAAFTVSASEGAAVAALWLALLVLTVRARPYPWPVLAGAAATAAASTLVASVFYSHLSSGPTTYWVIHGGFIEHHSFGEVVSTANTSTWNLLNGLFGLPTFGAGWRLVVVLAWLTLSVFALVRRPSVLLGPALVVAAAFGASAVHMAPLGTGRTDEYLYPALLLLLAVGVSEVAVALLRQPDREEHVEMDGEDAGAAGAKDDVAPHRSWLFTAAATTAFVALVVGGALLFERADHATQPYAGVDVSALSAAIRSHEQPGDHIFVSELMRYPWALYEDAPLHLEFGTGWATGFTVVSTDPNTFIVPSENYEAGSAPAAWAASMARYQRLWYVWFPPLGGYAPSYAALLRDGWHPAPGPGGTLSTSGCAATLLVRS